MPWQRIFRLGEMRFLLKGTNTEKTSCPAESKRTDVGIGYKTVATTIDGFVRLGQLPSTITPFFAFWNEGDGIQETFVRRKAVWHIKCKQRLFHGTRLGRLISSPGYSEPLVGHFEHDPEDDDEDSTSVSNAKNPHLTRSAENTTSTTASVGMLCFSVLPVVLICARFSHLLWMQRFISVLLFWEIAFC